MPRKTIELTPVSSATGECPLEAGSQELAIAAIRLRKDADSRPLTARHVVTLAESIAVLGLLEPVVVDTAGHLLAGGHRLAALQFLAESLPVARRKSFLSRCGSANTEEPNPELASLADRLAALGDAPLAKHYPKGRIPVQVVDVTGSDDLTLAVEAAENNVRRQYTREEIEALAARFKKAGYKTTPGKPRKGEKPMLSALEAAVGKSKRQIQRILDGDAGGGKTEWGKAVAALMRAAARVAKAGRRKEGKTDKAIVAAAEKALHAVGC